MANREPSNEPDRLDKEMIRLVDRLGHWWPWTRKAAKKTILERGTELTEPLLTLFDRERKRYLRRSKHYNRFAYGVLFLVYVSVAGALWCAFRNTEIGVFLAGVAIGFPTLILLLALRGMQYNTMRQTTTAFALAQMDDIRAVGPLAEALEFRDTSFLGFLEPRRHAVGALTRLLPALREEHADLLNATQRTCLARVLADGPTELAIHVLNAFQHVGTGQELPAVRRCADRRPWSATDRRVPAAARECLPILEERAREEKNSQTLLRPSLEAATAAPDVLLRAASGAAVCEPEQLLRAAAGEGR